VKCVAYVAEVQPAGRGRREPRPATSPLGHGESRWRLWPSSRNTRSRWPR
jgi:hypothetical protein